MQTHPHPLPTSESPPKAAFLDDLRAGLPWGTWAFPGILVLLLSISCIGLTYLWDDYAFLNNALRNRLWDFLPDPSDAFYRPLSRGVYFAILYIARDSGALLGHWINVVTLSLTACLVGAAGARLGGKQVGLCSGVVFAGLACVPTLVAWTCCSQDLLAMLFVMLALHYRMSGRTMAALFCMAFGILSKETALVTIPAILAVDWVRGRPTKGLWRETGLYALLVVAWASIHPAMRILIARGFRPGGTGYVGLAGLTDTLKHAGTYVLELCNLRVGVLDLTWSPWEIVVLIASAIGGTAATWYLLGEPSRHPHRRQVVVVGILLAVGPWLLTSAMVLGSSQYYAAFPGLGTSLILGSWLARRSRRVAVGFVALFLVLGLWSRATEMKTAYLTEGDLRISSRAHVELWRAMLRLQPTLPAGSQVLISVQAHGRLRVYHQVYNYQMPCLWYRDPTLEIGKPENRKAVNAPEFLFAVPQDLDIVRIDPFTFRTTTASGRPPAYLTVEQALRTYAMGLAGCGETDAAARLLVGMPEIDRNFESLHHRMAVMFLMADGREEDAKKLLSGIPPATRDWALDNLPAVLAQQPAMRTFDAAGLRAFGVDSTDVDALRRLTGWYLRRRYPDPAGRFADRLLARSPHDSTGLAAAAVRDSAFAARSKARIRED
ncbi:MAG: hypothetical protein AABZ94_01560 [Candidatus Eisenbacteria bacterium]